MAAGDRAYWADIANAVNPPTTKLVQQATQAISAAVALTFGTGSEEIDSHNFHDPSTAPTRITPTVAGRYRLTATLNMQAAAFSNILMVFRKNGANVTPLVTYRPDAASSAAQATQVTSMQVANGTTDYFEIIVQTTPTGTTSIASGGVQASTFECEYLGP